MKKSIVQDLNDRKCYICGSRLDLELHHCLHGTANRAVAEREELGCWLCGVHHDLLHDKDNDLDLFIKEQAQKAWEKQKGSREQWIALFGKNFL